MTKSQMFKRAHLIANTLEGNYSIRLSMALKQVWLELKSSKKENVMKELKGSEKQVIWANSLRDQLITLLKKEEKEELFSVEESAYIISEIAKIEDAKWFIENRTPYILNNILANKIASNIEEVIELIKNDKVGNEIIARIKLHMVNGETYAKCTSDLIVKYFKVNLKTAEEIVNRIK